MIYNHSSYIIHYPSSSFSIHHIPTTLRTAWNRTQRKSHRSSQQICPTQPFQPKSLDTAKRFALQQTDARIALPRVGFPALVCSIKRQPNSSSITPPRRQIHVTTLVVGRCNTLRRKFRRYKKWGFLPTIDTWYNSHMERISTNPINARGHWVQ